jgi:DNA-binding NarL/FixJ family response regulator
VLDILLVEDNKITADYQSLLLKDYNLTVVSTGREALEFAKKNKIDVIIQDLKLVDMPSYQEIQQIADMQKALSVIFVTSKKPWISKKQILKLESHENIRSVLVIDKKTNFVEQTKKLVDSIYTLHNHWTITKEQEHESLTNREMEVLCLFEDKLPRKEIARRLGISSEAVGEYRRRALEKLKAAYLILLCHPLVLELLEDIEPVVESVVF